MADNKPLQVLENAGTVISQLQYLARIFVTEKYDEFEKHTHKNTITRKCLTSIHSFFISSFLVVIYVRLSYVFSFLTGDRLPQKLLTHMVLNPVSFTVIGLFMTLRSDFFFFKSSSKATCNL